MLVAFVLDMSGSMGSVWQAAIEGANEYMRDLKEDESGETLFSLTVFDTVFEHWHVAEPVQGVPYLNDQRYIPRGNTALYDAIAHAITETETKLKELGREDMKVLCVTLTDGQENSSQEYSLYNGGAARLAALVKSYEAKGNWTFVYLGAGHANLQEARHVASGIGYRGDNAMLYASTPTGVTNTTSSLAAATATRRQSKDMSSDAFFQDAGQSSQNYADPNAANQPSTGGGGGWQATSLTGALGAESKEPPKLRSVPEQKKPRRKKKGG
jgi:hypothetical protein